MSDEHDDWNSDWHPGDDERSDAFRPSPEFNDPIQEFFDDHTTVYRYSLRELEALLHQNGYKQTEKDPAVLQNYAWINALTKDGKAISFQIWPDKSYALTEITEDIIIENEHQRMELANALMLLIGTQSISNSSTEHFRNWAFSLMRTNESLRTLVVRHLDQVAARKTKDEADQIYRRLQAVLDGDTPFTDKK